MWRLPAEGRAQSRKASDMVIRFREKEGSEALNQGHRDIREGVGCEICRSPGLTGWRLCGLEGEVINDSSRR